MENNFRILKTGGELSTHGTGVDNNNGGVNWLWIAGSMLFTVGIGVVMYHAGKNSVLPYLEAANKENEQLNRTVANCPYRKGQSSNNIASKQSVPENKTV